MKFWDNPVAIVIIVVTTLVILFAILLSSFSGMSPVPDLAVESQRNDVLIDRSAENRLDALPAPESTVLMDNDGVSVSDNGAAKLTFADGLVTELYRQGRLNTVVHEPESELIRLSHSLGTIFNDFNADRTVAKRLTVESATFDGFARIVSTTATGTEFIVARENDNPLLWVVALEATDNDLTATLIDNNQARPPRPLAAAQAWWVSPLREANEPLPFSIDVITQWLDNLRAGQDPGEIGDAIWQAAQARVDGDDFVQAMPPVIQRGLLYRVRLAGAQGFIDLILDPGLTSGNSLETALEDCNNDGRLDIPVQDELLQINFLPTQARVRQIAVEVFNRAETANGSLVALDPARQTLVGPLPLTAGPEQTQTFNATSERIFHYAELQMNNGCLLGLELIPPPSPPDNPTPSTTPSPTATPTPVPPTPTPTNTLPPPASNTPSPTPPLPTATATPTVVEEEEEGRCPRTPSDWVEYVVQVGDTLDRLGARVGLSVADLFDNNCLDSFTIRPGEIIYLPFTPPTLTPTPTATTGTNVTPPRIPTTPAPTTNRPVIFDCTPGLIRYELSLATPALTPTPSNQRRDFTCTGTNLRPAAQGFRAELRGPNGQNIFQLLGGDGTTLRGTIPTFPPEGSYDLIVTNPNGQSTIENNVLTVEVNPPTPGPKCFSVDPDSGFNDRDVTVSVQGRDFRPNEAGFRVELRADGEVFAVLSLTGSRSSTDFTAIVPADLPPGGYDLVVTNPDGQRCSIPYTVNDPLPDLIVSEFSLEGNTFQPREDISNHINLSIGNDSDIPISLDTEDYFEIGLFISPDADIDPSDRQIGSYLLTSLGARQTVNVVYESVVIPEEWPAGLAYIGVIVDATDAVRESDENNNSSAPAPVKIRGEPDLISVDFFGPQTARPGDDIGSAMGLIVTNQGTGSAGGFFVDIVISPDPNITTSDRLLLGGRDFVSGLGRGQSTDVDLTIQEIPQDWQSGDYYIGAIIDSQNDQVEINENNNTDVFPIRIIGQPDLIIPNLSGKLTPIADEFVIFEISMEILNQGDTTLDSFTIQWTGEYSSASRICSWEVEGLAAGERITLSNIARQDCYFNEPLNFFAEVDVGGNIEESNEANNICRLGQVCSPVSVN